MNVKGYTTPRSFSGFQIPIPLQSLAIRRYCEDHNYRFNHHVVENISPNTFFVLERVMQETHLYQAIAMCSLGMLPKDASYRHALLEQCTGAGVSVHFIFEQLVVNSPVDVEGLDELLSLTILAPSDVEQMRHIFNLIKRQ